MNWNVVFSDQKVIIIQQEESLNLRKMIRIVIYIWISTIHYTYTQKQSKMSLSVLGCYRKVNVFNDLNHLTHFGNIYALSPPTQPPQKNVTINNSHRTPSSTEMEASIHSHPHQLLTPFHNTTNMNITYMYLFRYKNSQNETFQFLLNVNY